MEPILPNAVKYPFITEETAVQISVGAINLRQIEQYGFDKSLTDIISEKK